MASPPATWTPTFARSLRASWKDRCVCHFLPVEQCDGATFAEPLLDIMHKCLHLTGDNTVLLAFSPEELRGICHGLSLVAPSTEDPTILTALIAAEVLRRGPPSVAETPVLPERLRVHANACLCLAQGRIDAQIAWLREHASWAFIVSSYSEVDAPAVQTTAAADAESIVCGADADAEHAASGGQRR